MWIIFLLASSISCFYLIIKTIIKYNKYEVNTKLSLIYEEPTYFPSITICNLNTFNADYSKEAIEEILSLKKITIKNSKPIDYVENATRQFKAPFNDKNIINENQLTYFGYFLDEMLLSCKFQGKECSSNDFVTKTDYSYGNCFTFNHNSSIPKQWRQTGEVNGLRLELFTGNIKTQQVFTYKTGFKVIIHNQSDVPIFEEEGIEVAAGVQTNIAVSRTFISRLSEPYSNCIQNDNLENHYKKNPFFKYLWNNFNIDRYTIKFCMKACLQEYITKACNCSDTRQVIPFQNKNLSLCITTEQVECATKFDILFHNTNDEINKCYEKCPNECNKIIYDKFLNTAKYPSVWYADFISKNPKYKSILNETVLENLERSMVVLNVYYDRNYYVSIKESPSMTSEDLFSYIGNNLGLFIGMSVLSFVEIIQVLFYLMLFFIIRMFFSNKNKVKDSNEIEMNGLENYQ